jgi:thioester reductase-like protein
MTDAGTIFVTGFPGFLGSRLLPRILARAPEARAACLVQPKFEGVAKSRLAELEALDPGLAGRVDLIEGDLTAPGLGMEGGGARLAGSIGEIWHLAAVYDLSVPRHVGMRVNVEGTRNVLRFASDCPDLRHHHYVSTCYVSGRHCGPFRETDLDVGQSFNNFYEETKFLAEVEVAEAGRPSSWATPTPATPRSSTGRTSCCSGWSASPPGPWSPWWATRRWCGSTWSRPTSCSTPSPTSRTARARRA